IREELHRLFELPGESLFKDQEELLTREAFAWSGFNQVRSAALLGITRNAMRTLLVNHGLIKAREKENSYPLLRAAAHPPIPQQQQGRTGNQHDQTDNRARPRIQNARPQQAETG